MLCNGATALLRPPACEGFDQLPTDVLVQVAGLADKKDVAQLALTCRTFRDKLSQRTQRELHGKRILRRQSKRFLHNLAAIQGLRSFLHAKNGLLSCYPPQEELLCLAFGPVGKRQTDFTQIMNQPFPGSLAGTQFAIVGMLTHWAEVSSDPPCKLRCSNHTVTDGVHADTQVSLCDPAKCLFSLRCISQNTCQQRRMGCLYVAWQIGPSSS